MYGSLDLGPFPATLRQRTSQKRSWRKGLVWLAGPAKIDCLLGSLYSYFFGLRAWRHSRAWPPKHAPSQTVVQGSEFYASFFALFPLRSYQSFACGRSSARNVHIQRSLCLHAECIQCIIVPGLTARLGTKSLQSNPQALSRNPDTSQTLNPIIKVKSLNPHPEPSS